MPNIESWELKAKVFEKKCIAMEKEVARVCPPGKGAALKSKMKANRKTAYDLEDKLSDSIPAAIKKGVTGKTWKDFLSDNDFKKALAGWEASLGEQQALVTSLDEHSAHAKKRFQDFKRTHDEFEKEMKKAGQTARSNKTLRKCTDKATAILADLATSKDAFGTLQAKEAFFGANLKKSRDAVVTKALKAVKGDELPDMLLENPKRQQVDNKTKRLARNVEKCTKQARLLCATQKFETIPSDVPGKKQLEKDVQSAKSWLKKASVHLKTLESLNKDLQTAQKKQAKLIAAHDDQSKMKSLIKSVADQHKAAEDAYNEAEDLVDEADSKL